MATRPSFATLPTEILQAIFQHLPPPSLMSVSRTSKSIKTIADAPVIWRQYCLTHFKSWSAHHNIESKFAGPLSDVDWRALFISRINTEKDTRRLLGKVLESQQGRIRYINDIAEFGYDAKETLLAECACPDDVEDVLARRYYANAVLERIQREMAIHVWRDISRGKDFPLEKALAAFDIFTRPGADVDFDIITQDLDHLANSILREYPNFKDLNTRNKAFTLASFMRSQGFKGVPDSSYRSLRNSFIGLALRSPNHESLPLISAGIYCSLASRLGLDARPCGYLYHVYVLVYAPPNHTLDGEYKPSSSSHLAYMYVDPFKSSEEASEAALRTVLREMGVPSSEHSTFMSDTSTREMALRTARNIMNSVQADRQAGNGIHSSWLNAVPDMDNAFYSALWAMMMLGPSEDGGLSNTSTRRRAYLPYLLEHFQTHYPWDVTLLEQHIIPLFYSQPEGQRLLTFVHSMHTLDSTRKPVKYRTEREKGVKFKVGQLFKHRRYNYEGVITGWDTHCDAGEEWIQHMGVDTLSRGREQSFYHVLVCDKSIRYVAEENISPLSNSSTSDSPIHPSEAMLHLAGRHFKRWDSDKCLFVSNVRDEYPDD
ncbi:YccV-like-domain-containing protein [Zopfia rhizophila CBS 207.26]|uniref:YccV-like-domain-containing protein n=1 Tax=Zopfia rhizophila CBS 207.26 TaxID=1314779 RepID=A0A6A6DHZ8_9PEZI|nr:YccV-like-domain-containing protein [Zopfia rhizophila CBS 207.26]